MNINVVNFNLVDISPEALFDESYWTFAANEWHRLYRPYVPFKEGLLYSTVNITAGSNGAEIEHTAPYAHYMYEGLVYGPNYPIKQNGVTVGFFSPPLKHPTGGMLQYSGLGSAHWDEAAAPTQMLALVQTLQNYINTR